MGRGVDTPGQREGRKWQQLLALACEPAQGVPRSWGTAPWSCGVSPCRMEATSKHHPLLRSPVPEAFVVVQSLSRVRLPLHERLYAACQASLYFTIFQSLLKHMSTESVKPSNHLILYIPFSSCIQSFPASGYFQMGQLFPSGGQSIRVSASASVFPMNIQDRSPLGWTDWISLQSKGLSRVFSSTTI